MSDYRRYLDIVIDDARGYQRVAELCAKRSQAEREQGETTRAIDLQESARYWADKAQRELTHLVRLSA